MSNPQVRIYDPFESILSRLSPSDRLSAEKFISEELQNLRSIGYNAKKSDYPDSIRNSFPLLHINQSRDYSVKSLFTPEERKKILLDKLVVLANTVKGGEE